MSQPERADDAFEAFYADAKDRVLRAVVASTGDTQDAEDCAAEAFARAYSRWDEVGTYRSPAAWVVRTAVNLHIDRHRLDPLKRHGRDPRDHPPASNCPSGRYQETYE